MSVPNEPTGPGVFWKKCLQELYFGLTGICVQVAYIVFVILSIPVYVFRQVVIHLATRYRPDFWGNINGISSYLTTDLFTGKSPRCSTILPITLRGHMGKEELTKIVQRNWIDSVEEDGSLKYPQFRTYPYYWIKFPFWRKDSNFNLTNHVHSYAEERGHAGKVTESDLNNLVEELLNAQYKPNRSPWDLYIIENYENPKICPGELSVLVMRIHHCIGDGFSLIDALVGGLFEIDLNDLNLPKISRPKRTFWQRLLFVIKFPFLGMCELFMYFRHFSIDNPWKAPDHLKAWRHRYANSELIPIENVKHIKSSLGVAFTSVLLSAISSGITKSIRSKREKGTLRVPAMDDYMLCLTSLPLPETEKTRKIRLKNNGTALVFGIPCGDFPTPVDRLKKCDQVLESCKSSVMPYATLAYVDSIGSHMGNVGYIVGKNRMVATGLTNFPTKPKTNKFGAFAGREIMFAEFASGTLVGDAGVGFMVVSFYPHIRFTVTAECAILSRQEIDELVKYIEDEFKILYEIANKVKPSNVD